ncbi:uncharacterized protein BKA78DRAFT_305217, partial [Phyllosticta capitalensis]|uniref:uncharacterized protein n=1 Tax=Phyllosticta capitalensis TaxID=121624 RepID=UPI003131B78E
MSLESTQRLLGRLASTQLLSDRWIFRARNVLQPRSKCSVMTHVTRRNHTDWKRCQKSGVCRGKASLVRYWLKAQEKRPTKHSIRPAFPPWPFRGRREGVVRSLVVCKLTGGRALVFQTTHLLFHTDQAKFNVASVSCRLYQEAVLPGTYPCHK